MNQKKSRQLQVGPQGFALIATISVMVLLVMIALAMLSLSSIELRQSGQGKYQAEAQANARLGLMLAIGELQKSAGPDQRITATADILQRSGHTVTWPKLVGVWKSWEGSLEQINTDTNTLEPISPGNYEAEKQNRHLTWLVSDQNATESDFAENNAPLSGNDLNHQVKITNSHSGNYAWIVYDEGVKAKIATVAQQQNQAPADLERLAESFSAPPSFNLETWKNGFENLPPYSSDYAKNLSNNQSSLLANKVMSPDVLGENFNNFTPFSLGLLVDVDRGGWKTDLSLLCEANTLPDHFKAGSGSYLQSPPESINRQAKWDPTHGYGIYNFYRIYKEMRSSTGPLNPTTARSLGSFAAGGWWGPCISEYYYNNNVRVYPVLARMHLILSYGAEASTEPNKYQPGLILTPVLTLWNPYNVPLEVPSGFAYNSNVMPFQLKFDTGKNEGWGSFQSFLRWAGEKPSGFVIRKSAGNTTDPIRFEPGEALIFSPTNASPSHSIFAEMTPGYRKEGGVFIKRGDPVGATGVLKCEIKPDSNSAAFRKEVYYSARDHTGGWYMAQRARIENFNQYFKNPSSLTGVDAPRVSSGVKNLVGSPEIFASLSLQVQTAADTKAPSLGIAQSNPFLVRTEAGTASPVALAKMPQTFVDFSMQAHSGANDSTLPQAGMNNGFVASGLDAQYGVTHCPIAELPQRPLQSLAALQHYDAAKDVFFLPQVYYVIGNSLASPIISPDKIRGGLPISHMRNSPRYVDHSYISNWKLFDHYFFSSIAPRPFSSSGIEATYQSFVDGSKSLPNARYIPYTPTIDADDVKASSPESAADWIASRLMVDGPFNINSTSVLAWQAFLSSLNESRPLTRDAYSFNASLKAANNSSFVTSRFDVPGGGCADTDAGNNGEIETELFWRGYRSLNAKQIEVLAEKIVDEVKKRGPFLSLNEFVNRQLSSNKKLAARGALQAALDHPDVTINDALKVDGVPVTPAFVTTMNYTFPEAAEGNAAFAAPGWVTQADLLRPMAPYMTPRSDTFRIRSYGDATDKNGKVVARAWCEAIVQRMPEYIHHDTDEDSNPSDGNSPKQSYRESDKGNPKVDSALSPVNRKFGRRFKVIQFRWLNAEEVTKTQKAISP